MAQSALGPEDPSSIGRYRLVARLGEGGMGVVYLGMSEQHGQVAIKVPRRAFAGNQDFRARFRREVLALGRVQGVCTVRVIESDTESARPFLVTEYASGPSLSEHVEASGPLDAGRLRGLATGLAEALAAIHRADVVHRDLKPSNVLLTATGPKVIDFGIAQTLDLSRLTRTGGAVGTPSYMAPEQFTGSSGPATDIYAWGLTVVFAASGQSPFGSGPVEVLPYRILHETPDISSVPEPLRPVVAAALAKDPAERPTALNLLWYLGLRTDQPVQTTTRVLLSRTWWMPPPTQAYTSPPVAAAPLAATAPLAAAAPAPPASVSVATAVPTPVATPAAAAATPGPAPAPTATVTPPLPPGWPPPVAPVAPATAPVARPPLATPPTASPVSAPPRSRRTALLIASGAVAALTIGAAAVLTANSGPGHPAASSGTHATSTRSPAVLPSPSVAPTLSATPASPAPSPSFTPPLSANGTPAAIPGLAGLDSGQEPMVAGLSCYSPGNCTVIGTYATGGTQLDAMFVADEVNGTWGPGTEPPGASTFEGESITVNAMSCASAGNCVAGGQYEPSYSYYPKLPFVVSETNGTWQTPTALTGLGSQVTNAQVTSVSCPSAGNCTVTGYANPGTFVADEVNGVWGAAHLLSVLDTTGGVYSGATLVSCATAGNCVVAAESYVYTERNGTWDGGQAIPGSPGPVNALSCAPDGGCSVGGSGGVDTTGNAAADIRGQAWTASEAGGSWTTAAVLPGIIPLDGGDSAQVTALACTNGGNCDLVAYGGTPEGNYVVLTEREISGTWQPVKDAGTGQPVEDDSTFGEMTALSCSSTGNCGAVGNNNNMLFETAGSWNAATLSSSTVSTAGTTAISCPTSNWCAIATTDGQGNLDIVGGSPS